MEQSATRSWQSRYECPEKKANGRGNVHGKTIHSRFDMPGVTWSNQKESNHRPAARKISEDRVNRLQ